MQGKRLFPILFLALLAACSPALTPATTATPTATGTPLPPPQAVDLGTLGKGAVSDIFWSPDGKILAVSSTTGIHLHNAQTWEELKTIPDRELDDRSLGNPVFTPDGKNFTFATTFWKTPGALWSYDLQSGEFSLQFEDASLAPRSAPVFSPDGDSFAILNNVCENTETEQRKCWDVLELRNSADGHLLYALQKSDSSENAIATFIFSPAGKQIAVASEDNFTGVWDTASGKLLYKFQHDSDVLDLAYSPDSRVLASASNDATVRFWDSQTGKSLSILSGFTEGVQRVAYLDHGKKLLVGELSTNRFQIYALDDQFLPVDSVDMEMLLGERRDPYYSRMESRFKTVISPDTRRMAVLLNETVRVWDLEKGKPILTLPEYHDMIYTWAFNSDASMLAAADHNIHLWDLPAKKWLTALPVNAYEIKDVEFSPDGKQLLVSADGNLTLWDMATFQKLREIKTESGISALAYAPDGKQFAIAGDGYVQILAVETGKTQREFKTDKSNRPLTLYFSPDGKHLYCAGNIKRMGWDLESGRLLYSIQTKPDRYGEAAITPNLGVFWQWDSDYYYFDQKSNPQWHNAFRFFDPRTGHELYNFANTGDSQYIDAALFPNGRLLAWHRNDRIDLLDAASGALLAAVNSRDATHLSLSPDSRILAAQAYANPIHLWDVSSVAKYAESSIPLTATPAPTIPAPSATPTVLPLSIETLSPSQVNADALRSENIARLEKLNELGLGQIETADWSPDGKRVALGGYPNVYIFDINNTKPLVTLPVEGGVMNLAFNPDGKMLAGLVSNGVIHVWDVTTGQSLYKTETIYCWNADIRFTPDSQVLSARCGWTTYRWNAQDGSLIDKWEDENQPYGTFSPDGNWLFDRGGTTARILDAKTQKIIHTIEVPEMTPHLGAFSPDGRTLMVWFYKYEIARSGVFFAGEDPRSVIQLWNIEAGKTPTLRATLSVGEWRHWEGYMTGYPVFSFTKDSHRLVTSSGDGDIEIWSVQSGRLLHTLPIGGGVHFSPNDNQLISIGDTVKIWDVTPGKPPVERWSVSGLDEFRSLFGLTGDELVTMDDGIFRFRAISRIDITKQPLVIRAPDDDMSISAISPNGKWLAYRTNTKLVLGKRDSENVNWQTLATFPDKPFVWGIRGVVFSPDSSMLAFIASDRKVLLWRLDDLESEPLELSREVYFNDLLFSPDSKLLLGINGASMEDEQPLYLWDATTGNLLRTWKTKGYQFAFHPAGETLAFTEYQSGKIFLYEFGTWKLLQEMQGQKQALKIAFTPDGRLLVTSGEKGTEFWDVATGELLRTIEELRSSLWFFSPDGMLLVVSVGDGRLQVWGVR